MNEIQFAESPEQLMFCFPVVHELRPLLKESEFVEKVNRMKKEGFHLVYITDDNKAVAAMGFRTTEMFYRGKSVYVDDLITLPEYRSKGYGAKLIDWVVQYAKDHQCEQVHLDSGVQRFDAHRFYLRKKFNISSHHFEMKLKS